MSKKAKPETITRKSAISTQKIEIFISSFRVNISTFLFFAFLYFFSRKFISKFELTCSNKYQENIKFSVHLKKFFTAFSIVFINSKLYFCLVKLINWRPPTSLDGSTCCAKYIYMCIVCSKKIIR